jgi:aspartyl-tRNA(Asn)/glutamyl-tRNA(Gln) amidotransferase subunit A
VGEELANAACLKIVDVTPSLPRLRGEWGMANQASLIVSLGDAYPDRIGELSWIMRRGLESARERFSLDRAASIEKYRRTLNEAFADLFEQADFVISSTNPDVAFAAEGPPPSTIPGADLVEELGRTGALMNNGALTAPSNMNGSPAVSIPAGVMEGLPVGLQVLSGHHREQWLLDVSLVAEREIGWPLVAPGSPHVA